jgi:hypothetical protein
MGGVALDGAMSINSINSIKLINIYVSLFFDRVEITL